MQRMIVRPDRLDLDSPGRRDYLVALEHDSIWGDHLLPLTVLVGPEARAGRGLAAFGSHHGNEYEGPVALKHLLGRSRCRTCGAGSSSCRCSTPRRSTPARARAPTTA
jgi:N-alpha-acetyl-L-2,4-diaminobutyrate deacetylase